MYTVIWRDAALDALADAFVAADLLMRGRIERAVTRLNKQLAADPEDIGESRGGKRRIAFEAPCGIRYMVDTSNLTARVTHFWTY
jgi:hypothetical protein